MRMQKAGKEVKLGRPPSKGRNELLDELVKFFGLSLLRGRGSKVRISIADANKLKKFVDAYMELKYKQ